MKVKDFGIKWHKDDAISVSVMIQELKEEPFDPILVYKPQGMKEPQYPMVPEDTFLLAIQTEFQMELYRRHASTILCIDSTHGTNQYRFKLIACVVPDDHGKGRSMIQIPYSDLFHAYYTHRSTCCTVFIRS